MKRKRTLGAARSFNTYGLFKDHETDWLFKRTLAYMNNRCAETGECLEAARHIDETDANSWIETWAALAARVDAQGDESLAGGHRLSARDSFLRAMNYYRSAEYACHPVHPRFDELWRKSCACMEKAAPLFPSSLRKVEVPFEGRLLSGYFWRPDDSPRKRPTLILAGGTDSSIEEMLMSAGPSVIERGYNLFTFDFPGHRGAVHRYPDCVRRPDYEVPFAAAIDFLSTLPGTDDRLAGRLLVRGIRRRPGGDPRETPFRGHTRFADRRHSGRSGQPCSELPQPSAEIHPGGRDSAAAAPVSHHPQLHPVPTTAWLRGMGRCPSSKCFRIDFAIHTSPAARGHPLPYHWLSRGREKVM